MPSIKVTTGAVIRGSHADRRIGSSAWVDGEGWEGEVEPRITATFCCEVGHDSTLEFHIDAELPVEWACRTCSARAVRTDPVLTDQECEVEPVEIKASDFAPVRPGGWYSEKHRTAVYSRRTVGELEAVLAERLALYRSTHPSPATEDDAPQPAASEAAPAAG